MPDLKESSPVAETLVIDFLKKLLINAITALSSESYERREVGQLTQNTAGGEGQVVMRKL